MVRSGGARRKSARLAHPCFSVHESGVDGWEILLFHGTVNQSGGVAEKEDSMAEIWPVYEGREPTIGRPWVRLPLAEAIALCELRPGDFLADLAARPGPRFGDVDRDLWYVGFKHVVVAVEEDEGKRAEWRPGFYKSRLAPKEVFRRLIEQALVGALGKDNVVRVELAPGVDFQGHGAIDITVVIAPDAVQNLPGGAPIDARARVRERLNEMRVDSSPIIHYATEAELAEDVDH